MAIYYFFVAYFAVGLSGGYPETAVVAEMRNCVIMNGRAMAFLSGTLMPRIHLYAPSAWMWILPVLLPAACGQDHGKDTLVIAVSANMQFAMEELAGRFTEIHGIECDQVVSSSGKLTAQISEGAPFDLFVSADMKYPETIRQKGLAAVPPRIYAYGRLVLWTGNDEADPAIGLLSGDHIRHIAIPNPKTAPYGMAATEVLAYHGIYDSVKGKLVYGESIAQVNQFILSGAAEIGFTALSVVLSPEMKGNGSWVEMPPEAYSPIAQGIVVIGKGEPAGAAAMDFYNFIQSVEATQILGKFGYTVHESP